MPKALFRLLILSSCLGISACTGSGNAAKPSLNCQQGTHEENGTCVLNLTPCQVNNTATVTFENRSTSSRTYDVIWDGSRKTTLGPTEKSQAYTESAGVQHTLQFKFSNSNTAACSQSTPTLAQCSSFNYWCTF